ncbi:hypothetical protein [Nitrosomonas communis]|uniref:Uncharacterized protein n=1 Tax=Nitrosomonas communis TaxID=44574 RepID=A0A1I4X196_9PROT|nr:hypothetical protein [Nitrosomonas communis]SFN19223.1 hypothetical protein SAMN05421863_11284 [Nitrosomonas communis]
MAGKASGIDYLVSAREVLKAAKTAEKLRVTQAVITALRIGHVNRENGKGYWPFC